MIASLPMYDWPEVEQFTNRWWIALREALQNEGIQSVPETLVRTGRADDTWNSSQLLISQTCGYPYTHGYSKKLRLLATPDYGVFGCNDFQYQSLILCRNDAPQSSLKEFAGTIAAINDLMSQSGFSAFRHSIARIANGRSFFDNVTISGSHRNSLTLLNNRKADICSVDPVSYALACRYVPSLTASLRIVAVTQFSPCLPFVTNRNNSDDMVKRIRHALFTVFEDISFKETREALFIKSAKIATEKDYQRILDMETDARNLNFPNVI